MIESVFTLPGNLPQFGVGNRLEITAFVKDCLAVGGLDGQRATRRRRTFTSASSSSFRSSIQNVPLPSPQNPM